MIECRPIRPEEASEFLQLLCRVFELEYRRAEPIFYNEPFFDLDRKWALFSNGRIASVLTTVPLEFGNGSAVGIAGVATDPTLRGNGFARQLVDACLTNEPRALLFAKNESLYRKCGFHLIDHVIRASFSKVPIDADAELLGFDDVRLFYDQWAASDPNRLVRNEKRWNFWKWNLRMCAEVPTGYFCQEGDTVREIVFDRLPGNWPIFETASWFGLQSMAESLNLPLEPGVRELMLLARGFDHPPQMFMTDQF